MNKKLITIRPSYLKAIISNPYNYFKQEKDISNLEQVKKGITREALSYKLYNQLVKGPIDYKQQLQGSAEVGEILLQGTADIVKSNCVIDIKNSVQEDNKLIEEYKWQLQAYCYIFKKEKAYLFIDNNKKEEMDLSKCRLIEVPLISREEFENILYAVKQAIKELNNLNTQLILCEENNDLDVLLSDYFNLKQQKKDIDNKLKILEKQLNKPYQNDKYSIHYEAQRKAIRSVNITYEDSYEYTLKIGENK